MTTNRPVVRDVRQLDLTSDQFDECKCQTLVTNGKKYYVE